jgi:Domain of unknown function (DUF1924)
MAFMEAPTMNPSRRTLITAAWLAAAAAAPAATPPELLAAYQAQAFFTTRHGGEWSCASCHGASPTDGGRHASTGKPIAPLAPAFDARRFTDAAKVEKWFRRNCNDVAHRECTAGEKADVIAWLAGLKP